MIARSLVLAERSLWMWKLYNVILFHQLTWPMAQLISHFWLWFCCQSFVNEISWLYSLCLIICKALRWFFDNQNEINVWFYFLYISLSRKVEGGKNNLTMIFCCSYNSNGKETRPSILCVTHQMMNYKWYLIVLGQYMTILAGTWSV